MDRLTMLKKIVGERPGEPFPLYGLAMEYRRLGQLDDAWNAFKQLIERNPDYVPTYLMAGGVLVAMDQKEQATDIYEQGIALTKRCGDGHAQQELESALGELQ